MTHPGARNIDPPCASAARREIPSVARQLLHGPTAAPEGTPPGEHVRTRPAAAPEIFAALLGTVSSDA